MQFPIIIGLHRSRFQLWIYLGLAVLASLVVLSAPWFFLIKLVLLSILWFMVWRGAGKFRMPVQCLRLSRDGQVTIRFIGREDEFFPMRILTPITVHPWLTVLRLEYEAQTLVLVLTPDCLSVNDFRCLRAWLKWQAIFSVSDDA